LDLRRKGEQTGFRYNGINKMTTSKQKNG